MDQSYISTFAALGGTVVGGLASFATARVTQSLQSRYARVTADIIGTFAHTCHEEFRILRLA
jgi:hypothetical protein